MDYTDSNDTNELLNFIIKKRENKEITLPSQLLYFFCKAIKISLINTYKEQNSYKLCIHCVNIIDNIFRLIYNYSLNIKLSIFICERSVLLFNEYINISNSYNSEKINIVDIKQFIINKSIGPIIIESKRTLINKYEPLLEYLKTFICSFFMDNINKDYDINFYIESLIRTLSTSLIDIYDHNLQDYIEEEFLIFKQIEMDNIIETINLIKIKFEILLFLAEKNKKKTSMKHINDIVTHNCHIKDLLSDFNEDENIKDSIHFKKLIKNI